MEESAELMALAIPDVQRAVKETKAEPNQTRGSPESEGKASREPQKKKKKKTNGKISKYLPESRVGKANMEFLRHQLMDIYHGVSDAIADGVAIEQGNKVYIVDSGRDNGRLDFAVKRIKTISADEGRAEFIRSENDRARSKGDISPELLEKFEYGGRSDLGRNMRREHRAELSADNTKPQNNQSGVSQKNADGERGLTEGKASRELDVITHMDAVAIAEGREMYEGKAPTDRERLANALESITENDIERKKLKEYKANIEKMNAETEKLKNLKAEIKELTFGKGKKDPEKLKKLKAEATKTENRINTYDKMLLDLEASSVLKGVLMREKQKAYKRAAEKGR